MIYTDYFIYLLYKGIYLGQEINFGIYYGAFQEALTIGRNVAELRELMSNLQGWCNTAVAITNGNLLERLQSLSDTTRLSIDTCDVYGKYDGGQTQKMSFALNKRGTRTSGLTGGLPPSTTINISASSEVYGETGANRGLWGVDESDQIDGDISPASVVYTAATNVAAWMSQTRLVDGIEGSYNFSTCTVKRIPYITSKGKTASRLPLQPLDVPSCYLLGSWGVKPNTGNNKKRRKKTGGR